MSRIILCLLYQISEHIIVHITLTIILVVSLLPLPRNKTNSHFLNKVKEENPLQTRLQSQNSKTSLQMTLSHMLSSFMNTNLSIQLRVLNSNSPVKEENPLQTRLQPQNDKTSLQITLFIQSVSLFND